MQTSVTNKIVVVFILLTFLSAWGTLQLIHKSFTKYKVNNSRYGNVIFDFK